RKIEGRASSFRVVVDEKMRAVTQRNGVRAGVGIRQVCQLHPAPSATVVVGTNRKNTLLARAAERLQATVTVLEYAGLDRADRLPVIQVLCFRPSAAKICRRFKIDAPVARDLQCLVTGRTEDRPVLE